MTTNLTPEEQETIRKYFGKSVIEMDEKEFRELHRQLRTKYHPDNFEKFEDETVREMATERFQQIEKLAEKLSQHFQGEIRPVVPTEKTSGFSSDARFAFNDMKIEINTNDKDLKYHLFGTRYRWLLYGDSFKIPETEASIIIDEDHRGHQIGFRESIRLYLSFDATDPVPKIVEWLYEKIHGHASSLIIQGRVISIEPAAMINAIQKISLLG